MDPLVRRKVLTFHIGLSEPAWEFEEPLIKEACALAGGCTVKRDIGYWIEGAHKTEKRYSGPVDSELCFTMEVMCGTQTWGTVYFSLRAAIKQLARKHGVPIDWVHVELRDCHELHFQATE